VPIKIHNKFYKTVSERVNEFRKDHPLWTIKNTLVSMDEKEVIFTTEILDDTGRLIASGYAHETRNASKILTTSALEVCETSSVGRALAFFGLAGDEIASANEIQVAIKQQSMPTKSKYVNDESALRACGTEAELQASWSRIYESHKADLEARRYLGAVKDECKVLVGATP